MKPARDGRRNTLEPPKELEFIVDDVDSEYERLRQHVGEVVTTPTTMPWGNRALLFRDPDGNLVNLFTPVTEEGAGQVRDVSRGLDCELLLARICVSGNS